MSPRQNQLLAPLPDKEYQLFLPHLQLVSLVRGQVLFDKDMPLRWVHYPVGAVVSLLIFIDCREMLEVLMMGKHCMVGLGALMGPSPFRARVLSSGLAYRMPVEQLQQLRGRCPHYQMQVAHAMQRSISCMGLNALCSRHHALPQQLRRWLLTHMDLSDNNTIHITHDELAEKLGYRREMVTHCLGTMAKTEGIALHRGLITVRSREELMQGVCPCYQHQQEWITTEKTSLAFG